MKEVYKSKVYTERPAYADFDSPAKFQAIQSIVARRLTEHPHAICSYSGGADSDIMIDVIERTRELFILPPVKYVFFNTGLEMKATRDHVRDTAQKYCEEIEEVRPKINIVTASRTYGIPFVSKIMSAGLSGWQKKKIPLSIAEEYEQADDKAAKRAELRERYPKCESVINFLCCCNSAHMPREAARIFLRVTELRVERLQDITELDILENEGVTVAFPQPKPSYISLAYSETRLKPAVRKAFADLWDSTIKKADRALYGWEVNPWVWVIEFERISKEEASTC